MPSTPTRRPAHLQLVAGDPPAPMGTLDVPGEGWAYPHLEDIVLRGLLARPEGQVLDTVCDVIVALELEGVLAVSGTLPPAERAGNIETPTVVEVSRLTPETSRGPVR